MANLERYATAHRALESVAHARRYLGVHADELEWRMAGVLRAGSPEPAKEIEEPPPSENPLARRLAELDSQRAATRSHAIATAESAGHAATRLRNEIARLLSVIRPIEEKARADVEQEDAQRAELQMEHMRETSFPRIARYTKRDLVARELDFLVRRLRGGLPLALPTSDGLDHLVQELDKFIAAAPRRSKDPKPKKITQRELDASALFELSAHITVLQDAGFRVTPKHLAAAEVLATGRPFKNTRTAAHCCRKWERLLGKARENAPWMREWLAETRADKSEGKAQLPQNDEDPGP